MNKEMYTVIGVGVALAAIVMTSFGGLRTDMREEFAAIRTELTGIRSEISGLGERVTRIEVRLDIPVGESSTAVQ